MLKLPYNAPEGFDWVVGFTDWHLTDGVLHIRAETANGHTARLTFRAVTADIWRMTFTPPGGALVETPIVNHPLPLTASVSPHDGEGEKQLHPLPPSPVDGEGVEGRSTVMPLGVEETEKGMVVRGARLRLEVDKNPWAVRLLDENGFDVFRENPSDIDGLGRPFVLPLGYAQTEAGITLVSESFHLRPDEHLFGLGEKFTPLDKVGQKIISWTQDAFGSTSERSHKNIPFFISTRGYGLLLDTGARVTWELGTVSCQSGTIIAETTALDAYIIAGETPADILQRYTDLTGRSPVPPKWTFGLWVSSCGTYRDQETNQRLVDGLEIHQIPADVLHLDPWWMKWRTYCDFQWNREAFPDVEGFIAGLKARGLKLCLWEHPYISVESELFAVGVEKGYFLKRPDGEVYIIDYGLSLAPRPDGVVRVATPETSWNARVAIIDLTNPEAYTWFQDLHRPVLRMGVDVFKTDFGEDVPHDAVFHNGQTGATMHNLYPLLYNQCVYEVTEQEKGYGVVWSRAGTAGNQRYPVCWSGDPAADFESLACTIRGGLSIGMSGVAFWSNDIGAYRGMPSPRLYVRWAQFGLMCSHSRMHGDSPREPWMFGQEATDIVRKYVELRYQLFPYLYSAAITASQTGMSVIRAMPLAFPHDPNTYDKDLQYMLGDSLLVAPIYDAGEQRSVYLPEGAWVDYWTREIHHGPTNITVHAPLDTLPMFVRGGAIIPMMPPASRIPEGRIDPLIVTLYPQTDTTYHLHEDEGVTVFSSAVEAGQIVFRWQGEQARGMVIRFVGVEQVKGVNGDMEDLGVRDGDLEVYVPSRASGEVVVQLSSDS
jgi:alpha-D-xyloside xylohydrolase